MSIVEREQWNSSKEQRAAYQSETYDMIRRAMLARTIGDLIVVNGDGAGGLAH